MATEENIRHPKIKRANARSSIDLQQFIPTSQSVKGVNYFFQVVRASELEDVWREEIWDIFHHNMKVMYESSSFGWDPTEKKEEMFHPLSRFLLVWLGGEKSGQRSLCAYSIFRFEREDDRNLVYCYEMQIKESAQRTGLGRALLSCLEAVGRGVGMIGMMLTVFIANVKAQAFYESQGFKVDPTSPEFEDPEEDEAYEADYRILSRSIE